MATTVSTLVMDALPRLAGQKPTGTTLYQAINYVTSMLAKRIINRRSDLLVSLETTWTVTPAGQYYNLPTGFVSLAENPFSPQYAGGGDDFDYGDGGDYHLGHSDIEPLDKHRSYYQHRTALVPRRYELLGQQIVFYPPIDPSVTSVIVVARYRGVPAPISGPSGAIPFNGMFDQAYFQGVPRVMVKGLAVIQADADFEAFLSAEVDSVLVARSVPLPDNRMRRRSFL
jgi:hypothetical protein